MYTRPLARLIEHFQHLPGVGPKTAQRLALHILKRPEAEVAALAQALIDAKKQVKRVGESIVKISEGPLSITIENGKIACKIPKNGTILLDSLKINGQLIGTSGQLICLKQDGLDDDFSKEIKKESFKSNVKKVTIEQLGDIKTVIKIEGVFTNAQRSWLPFIVRLYFYAGVENIKIVQTLIYDGQGEKDFIKGLGWEFKVPLREEILNRHIRFGGENNSDKSIVNNALNSALNKELNSVKINSENKLMNEKNELINAENKIKGRLPVKG